MTDLPPSPPPSLLSKYAWRFYHSMCSVRLSTVFTEPVFQELTKLVQDGSLTLEERDLFASVCQMETTSSETGRMVGLIFGARKGGSLPKDIPFRGLRGVGYVSGFALGGAVGMWGLAHVFFRTILPYTVADYARKDALVQRVMTMVQQRQVSGFPAPRDQTAQEEGTTQTPVQIDGRDGAETVPFVLAPEVVL